MEPILITVIDAWPLQSISAPQSSGVSVSVFDVGIGIRYFAIIYNFWFNTATAMSVGSFHVHVGLFNESNYKRRR